MTPSTGERFEALEDRLSRLYNLEAASSLLQWDQQVMMPSGGTPARSRQQATLAGLEHQLAGAEAFGRELASVRDRELTDEEAAIVREATRRHRRAEPVPQSLIEQLRETTAKAHSVWEQARAEDHWETFAPILTEIVALRREQAEAIDPDREPYEVLYEEYEPYLSLERTDAILTELREGLVPLLASIEESTDLAAELPGPFAPTEQAQFSRAVLDELGYDWEHGRLDTATHPFTSGNQFDARITTRYDEDSLLSGLMATIHEFGHASYELGLPKESYGNPLGQSRDLTVHESQSRFWENHVGRSAAFWESSLPLAKEHFPQLEGIDSHEAFEAANRVYPDNLIRVEADELTYHLHIVIRYEIERALIGGDLEIEDVPTVWNDKYEAYLGIRPPTDREGCLQDVHWSSGYLGYFPTYSLGSVLAAQLTEAVEESLGPLDQLVRAGEYDAIRSWMQERIYRHGQQYRTSTLIERATGAPLEAAPFLNYVTEKYEGLYAL